MNLQIHAHCDFGSYQNLLNRLNLQSGGEVQKAIDTSVIRFSEDYCPMDTGYLAHSPYGATVIGSGEVVYPGPAAHYLYYGEVYGPNIPVFDDDSGIPTRYFSPPGLPKHPTGRPLTYATDKNALAVWVRRMWADHSSDVIREAQNAVGK